MNAKKIMAMILAVVLLMTATIAGTIAWLTDNTQEVQNTFTVGNIDITLEETGTTTEDGVDVKDDYKIIPGNSEAKDPKVTVEAGSEACYVFIQIEEVNNNDPQYINWGIANGWNPLKVPTDKSDKNYYVYYREQNSLVNADADAAYYVLAGDTVAEGETQSYPNGYVSYPNSLTKAQIEALYQVGEDGNPVIDSTKQPSLSFKAFAVQKANVADAATAWSYVPAEEKLDYVAPNP